MVVEALATTGAPVASSSCAQNAAQPPATTEVVTARPIFEGALEPTRITTASRAPARAVEKPPGAGKLAEVVKPAIHAAPAWPLAPAANIVSSAEPPT